MKIKAKNVVRATARVGWRTIHAGAHNPKTWESAVYLKKMFAEDFDGKTVVVTHHLSFETIADCYVKIPCGRLR